MINLLDRHAQMVYDLDRATAEVPVSHLYSTKRQLAQKQIRIVCWRKVYLYFSEVLVAAAGEDIVLRYVNQAIKTEVEKLLM